MSFDFKLSQAATVFAIFDGLIAITTHPRAYISRSGSFDLDNNDDKQITLPLAHANGIINDLNGLIINLTPNRTA